MAVKEQYKDLQEETRKRVERMKEEFSAPPKIKVFENVEKYDQIIAQVNIPVTALCEHHEVAFFGSVSIAYIPRDYIVGLSKLARVAEYYLNPTVRTVQEKATQQILNHLQRELKPKGLMVVVKATHNCIVYRGVKKPSLTITSAVKGIFADPKKGARQEFLQLIASHSEN